MARKYLSIPVTSVPRNGFFLMQEIKLLPKETGVVSQLLFVKRNGLYCNVWALINVNSNSY